MKNDKIYITLEDRIAAFKEYCNSQVECPCKFHNEHCELKWLDTEAAEIATDLFDVDSYIKLIEDMLKSRNWYMVLWQGSLCNQVVICELPENPVPKKTNTIYRAYCEEFYNKYEDGKKVISFDMPCENISNLEKWKYFYHKLLDIYHG